MSVSMWFYFQRVLIPYQAADAAAHNRPRGTLSDLYPRWLGSRELLMNGRDPYSDEITREIQEENQSEQHRDERRGYCEQPDDDPVIGRDDRN